MKLRLCFLLVMVLATACATTHTPTPTEWVEPVLVPSQTTSSSSQEITQPTAPSLPTFTAELPTQTPLPDTLTTGPNFPQAFSGGADGSAYPEQDISIIAKTGHIQFINVYANW